MSYDDDFYVAIKPTMLYCWLVWTGQW